MTIFNYTVNYADVAIVGIMILTLIIGYSRGIIITIINFIRYCVGLFLCMFVSNQYTQIFYNTFIKQKIISTLNENVVTSSNVDEIINNLANAVDNLPEFIKNNIDLSSLSINANNDLSVSITENLFEPVALVIVKVLLFLLTFVVFFGLTSIILFSVRRRSRLKEKNKKSSLKKIDKIFGGLFGCCKGALIVCVLVSLFAVLFEFGLYKDTVIMNEVSNSTLYNYLVDINPFNIITEKII